MNKVLTQLLDQTRLAYIEAMEASGGVDPYLTAHRVAHEQLMPTPEQLAELVAKDYQLLAARAYELIEDPQEAENPCIGAIIYSNIFVAALDGLLRVAVRHGWLEEDEEGQPLVEAQELDRVGVVHYTDFSRAQPVLGVTDSIISRLFNAAEQTFVNRLNSEPHNAYNLAIEVASDYAMMSPDELGPLIAENPILLALRLDGRLREEVGEPDPPAGLIVGLHLTQMVLQQLLEVAQEEGALAIDSAGEIILPDSDEDNPTVH